MGKNLYEQMTDWAEGVNTSIESDQIPPNASPRGRNAALTSIGGGKAVVSKRRGIKCTNPSQPVSGSPVVLGVSEFRRQSGGTFTTYRLIASDNGRFDYQDNTDLMVSVGVNFTVGTYFPDFATMNNLAFIANGQDRKKFNTVPAPGIQEFGITAPATAPTLADSGAAGNHNGTYEARVTYYNSLTGHESSAGTTSTTVTVVSKQINWTNIPVSSDTQVDTRKLYLRNTTTQTNFYLVSTIGDNTTTIKTTNTLDTNLITVGPDTAENNRPPTGIKYLETYLSRMFAADDTTLYYSKVNLPEAFDPDFTENVSPNDGQKITGLHAAQEILVIFKSNSMYGLYGPDPASWEIRLISPDIGCVANRSIVTIEGITYWWSEQGPVMWDGTGVPRTIGADLISTTISPDSLNFAQLNLIHAVPDQTRSRVVFCVPEVGQSRCTAILPWNYRLMRWEGIWDPMDLSCSMVTRDSNGQPYVYFGNYAGQIFRLWDSDNDGVLATTTSSGTFVASGTSISSFTDGAATFDTTGGKLIERKVTIVDSNGVQMGSSRPRITGNTATVITLATSVSGLTNGATYTYYIGGPDFQWDTYWADSGLPFHKKRFEFLYMQMKATSTAVTVRIDLAFNFDTSSGQTKRVTFSTTAPSATWNSSLWDAASYGTLADVNARIRVGRTGRVWRVRIRNAAPDQSVTLTKVGMKSELLGDKIG